jgi:hypothetical protein
MNYLPFNKKKWNLKIITLIGKKKQGKKGRRGIVSKKEFGHFSFY